MPSYGSIDESLPDSLPHHKENTLCGWFLGEELPSGNEPEESPLKGPLFRTRNDLFTLISCAMITYFGFCAFSIIAPFYPSESKEKNVGKTITGLVFAIYPFFMFLASPLVGKMIPSVGAKFMLLIGCFIEGVAEILFGFVSELENRELFIIYCLIIRSVTAIGAACCETSALAILSNRFRDNISRVFGIIELFSGLGLMTGPPLGGLLYKHGGFRTPFIVIGCAVLVNIIFAQWILPNPIEHNNQDNSGTAISVIKVLFVPGILVTGMIVMAGTMFLSFMESSLSTHILAIDKTLEMDIVGVIFLIAPGLYTCLAPIVGYLTDRHYISPRVYMLIGQLICSISYLLLGPSPLFKGLKPTIWLICISMVLLGVGISLILIPPLADMQQSLKIAGLPLNLSTNSILSGLMFAFISAGNVIGPTLGGAILEVWCFNWATTVFACYMLLVAFFVFGYTWLKSYKRKKLSVVLPKD